MQRRPIVVDIEDSSTKNREGAPLVFLISSSLSLFISSLKSYNQPLKSTCFIRDKVFPYLNYSLHHSLLLIHLNWSLLLFLSQGLVYSVSIQVEIEEGSVFRLGRVEIGRIIFERLESSILRRCDSLSAVDHHLGQNFVHQSLFVLSRMLHHKILDGFLKN